MSIEEACSYLEKVTLYTPLQKEVVKTILDALQPQLNGARTMDEQEKKLREQIANSVDDYLFYNCRCPNKRDEIIRRILGKREVNIHCKTDCDNTSCSQNQTQLVS